MNRKKLLEVDLYKPIQKYFEKQGYDVYSEVKHCDVVAVKNEKLIIVEQKLHLNLELLVQATKRQRMCENVYIAIPKPSYSMFSRKWRDLCHLVRRLELGLIIVSFNGNRSKVEVKLEPTKFDRKRSMKLHKSKGIALWKEIEGRSGDYNTGGSSKTKIVTAYKETCIHIAVCLREKGQLSPKELRQMGTGEKTAAILQHNYYEWFERVKRGIYQLSEIGEAELDNYSEIAIKYRKDFE